MEFSFETLLLIIATVFGVIMVTVIYPQTQQDDIVVNRYIQEQSDNVDVIDLLVQVTEGTTEEEIRQWLHDNYQNYEIIEISKVDNSMYAVRLRYKKVVE